MRLAGTGLWRGRSSRSSAPQDRRAAHPCADKAQAVAALHAGDEYQATALLFASARLGCEREARALLNFGAAVDARDREGATALGRAAQAGKTALAGLLIDKGANVNARAVDGSTPLFYAAEADRAAMVLAAPRSRGQSQHFGATGSAAARRHRLQWVDGGRRIAIEACGAPSPRRRRQERDGLCRRTRLRPHSWLSLIAAGVDVNRRYDHGLTALMWAAGHDVSAGVDDVEATVKLLIERGADRAAKTIAARRPPTSRWSLGMRRPRNFYSARYVACR